MLLFIAVGKVSAAVPTDIAIRGQLKGFDKEFIWIENEGHKLRISRKRFGSLAGYIAGKAVITVVLPMNELVSLNKEVFAK